MALIDDILDKAYGEYVVSEQEAPPEDMADGADDEIFTVQARRCKRCGILLHSKQGLRDGLGHYCKQKYAEEHRLPDPNQITFFDAED